MRDDLEEYRYFKKIVKLSEYKDYNMLFFAMQNSL